jgi:hypothetical protein
MHQSDIPQDEWAERLNVFALSHDEQACSLSVDGAPEAEHLSLAGIEVDTHRQPPQISITAGEEPDQHVVHLIEQPTAVRLDDDNAQRAHRVEIDSEDGSCTILELE